MREAHPKQLAFSSRTRVKAAIGCLDMARAFYRGARVHAGARKLQILSVKTTKNRVGARKNREKNFAINHDSL